MAIDYSLLNLSYLPTKDSIEININDDIVNVEAGEKQYITDIKQSDLVVLESVDSFVNNLDELSDPESNLMKNPKLDSRMIPVSSSVNAIIDEVSEVNYEINEPESEISGNVKKSNLVEVNNEGVKLKKLEKAKIEVFLYNLMPYIVSEGIGKIEGLKNANDLLKDGNPNGEIALAAALTTTLHNAKYFSVGELIRFTGANFYLLRFFRGITAKSFDNTFSVGKKYEGEINISFGKNSLNARLGELKENFLKGASKIGFLGIKYERPKKEDSVSDNSDLIEYRNKYSTKITFNSDGSTFEEELTGDDIFDDLTFKITKITDLVTTNAYLANNKLIHNKVKYDNSFVSKRDKISITNPRILDVKDFSYVEKDYKTENYSISDLKRKEHEDLLKNLDSYKSSNLDSIVEESVKSKSILSNNNWRLGALYVMPVKKTSFNFKNFWIPFEFNPKINEGGVSANYQSTSVLSRIGNMQTFVNVNSQTVTLTTSYYTLHDNNTDAKTEDGNWMKEATLENIQAIELAYRSLVLPSYPSNENEATQDGYKYVRPPIIRVVMGSTEDSNVYSNLLTYQKEKVYNGKLQSVDNNWKIYKNFIVTNVTINKDLEATPIYTGDDNTILDTYGFEVTLNLIEVTPSYMDQLPDFNSYYQGYMEVYDKAKG